MPNRRYQGPTDIRSPLDLFMYITLVAKRNDNGSPCCNLIHPFNYLEYLKEQISYSRDGKPEVDDPILSSSPSAMKRNGCNLILPRNYLACWFTIIHKESSLFFWIEFASMYGFNLHSFRRILFFI